MEKDTLALLTHTQDAFDFFLIFSLTSNHFGVSTS